MDRYRTIEGWREGCIVRKTDKRGAWRKKGQNQRQKKKKMTDKDSKQMRRNGEIQHIRRRP